MKKNKLAGKFSLLAKNEKSVYVGILGGVNIDSLSYGELRSMAEFYVDGWFVLNAVTILGKNDAVTGAKLPLRNFEQILKFDFTCLEDGVFTVGEYASLMRMEKTDGIDIIDRRYAA